MKTFICLGLNIKHHEDFSIRKDQLNCTKILFPVTLSQDRAKKVKTISCKARKNSISPAYWAIKLDQWHDQTRNRFREVWDASKKISRTAINNVPRLSKEVKQVQAKNSHVRFPSLDLSFVKIITDTDAIFNNHPQGGSQGGQTILIFNNNKQSYQSYGTH